MTSLKQNLIVKLIWRKEKDKKAYPKLEKLVNKKRIQKLLNDRKKQGMKLF